LVLSTFLILIGVQGVAAVDEPVPIFLSKDLGVGSMSDVAAAMDRPLDDHWGVKLAAGEKLQVRTCRDFLRVTKSRFELQDAADWAAWWQQGAHCFALDALKGARPALRTNLGWFRFSKQAIAKLPPRLALLESPDDLDEVAAAEKSCHGWGRFDETLKVRVEAPDKAALRSDGWMGRLVLYARADIDGDGLEDLLIRRDGHATGGTAAESRVFVVTQLSPTDCTRVVRVMGAPDSAEPP
jgi:hypothetical protein